MVGMAPVAYMHHKRAPISAFAPFVNIIDVSTCDLCIQEVVVWIWSFAKLLYKSM